MKKFRAHKTQQWLHKDCMWIYAIVYQYKEKTLPPSGQNRVRWCRFWIDRIRSFLFLGHCEHLERQCISPHIPFLNNCPQSIGLKYIFHRPRISTIIGKCLDTCCQFRMTRLLVLNSDPDVWKTNILVQYTCTGAYCSKVCFRTRTGVDETCIIYMQS